MRNHRFITMMLALVCALCLAVGAVPTLEGVESSAEAGLDAAGAQLASDVTSELLFYQDFDSIAPGVYESIESMIPGTTGTFTDIASLGWGVISTGCTFEVCEEPDGNRYVKVTGDKFKAFGVCFADKNLEYAVMSFNYKYPTSGNCRLVNEAAYRSEGVMHVGGDSDGNTGNWNAPKSITNNTNTEWTQQCGHSYVQSPCLGLGFAQGTGTVGEIYIDDFAVWSFSTKIDDPVNPAHTSAVPKTITFANSTGCEGATMPEPITRNAWYNFYNGQSNVEVNLNSIEPLTAPAGYVFAGWSASDGGQKIKDCHYDKFKCPGDITLYALWEEGEAEAKKPVAKYENFESFEVGEDVTGKVLDFLKLNQFGGTTATIVLDEATGSKCVRLDGHYAGFKIVNRTGTAADKEYMTFSYRFDELSEEDAASGKPGSKFQLYAGKSHDGGTGSHKQALARTLSWNSVVQGATPADTEFGGFFDAWDRGWTIYFDDIYYWYIPAGLEQDDKKVTVTFAPSTVGILPENATMPAAVTKNLWEDKSDEDNTLNVTAYKPTDYDGIYRFAGWSRTDGGKVLVAKNDSINCVMDMTLYAVWEYAAPVTSDKISIRTSGVQGIRFLASLPIPSREASTEYGFIATRKRMLDDLGYSVNEMTFDLLDDGTYVYGVAYKPSANTDILYDISEDGSEVLFSGVLVGVPESKENYTETLYARPYVKYGDLCFYGEAKGMSLYEAAKAIKASEGYVETEYVERIIAVCEAE